MMFAIKAEVNDPRAETFAFNAQKTMYRGKHIAKGETIFIFASENEGGSGLIASGVVTSAKASAKKRGIARQTHCAREAAPWAERSQIFFQLERRATRDGAQFQILSSGNEQDRRH